MLDPATGSLRLTREDFDAFLEAGAVGSKPAVGASTPEAQRRALRERMEAWAKGLLPQLRELGLAFEVVVPDEPEEHLTSGAPRLIAQRVLFVRDAFARSALPERDAASDTLRSHAYLALVIDAVHVAVSLEFCPEAICDVKNARARISDPSALLELTALLEAMPEQFSIGVIGVPSFPRAQAASARDIRALLDDSERNRRPLWLGWSVSREAVLEHVAHVDDMLADALVALAHIYKLLAWSTDNDLIAAQGRGIWRTRPSSVHEQRRQLGREERRRRQAQVREKPTRKVGSRREREEKKRVVSAPEAEAAPASATPRQGAADSGEAPPLERASSLGRRPMLHSSLRGASSSRSALDVDPTVSIERGTRVRVLGGPFVNKVGVVEELSSHGRVRVRLGLLVATVDLHDVVASRDGARPKLPSSHRHIPPKKVRKPSQ